MGTQPHCTLEILLSRRSAQGKKPPSVSAVSLGPTSSLALAYVFWGLCGPPCAASPWRWAGASCISMVFMILSSPKASLNLCLASPDLSPPVLTSHLCSPLPAPGLPERMLRCRRLGLPQNRSTARDSKRSSPGVSFLFASVLAEHEVPGGRQWQIGYKSLRGRFTFLGLGRLSRWPSPDGLCPESLVPDGRMGSSFPPLTFSPGPCLITLSP